MFNSRNCALHPGNVKECSQVETFILREFGEWPSSEYTFLMSVISWKKKGQMTSLSMF
jgi:hypothetical protein